MSSIVYCTSCGTPLARDDRFCASCGKRVGDLPASEAIASETAESLTAMAAATPSTSAADSPAPADTVPPQGVRTVYESSTFEESLERAERYADEGRERIAVSELLSAERVAEKPAGVLTDAAQRVLSKLYDETQRQRVVDMLGRHNVAAPTTRTDGNTRPAPELESPTPPTPSPAQAVVGGHLTRAGVLLEEGRERLGLRALTEAAAAAGTDATLRQQVVNESRRFAPGLQDSSQRDRLENLVARIKAGARIASLDAPHDEHGQTKTAGRAQSPTVGGWGFAIFFFGILGGFIGWLDLKEKDRRRADHVLKWGAIWTAISIAVWILLVLFLSVTISASS